MFRAVIADFFESLYKPGQKRQKSKEREKIYGIVVILGEKGVGKSALVKLLLSQQNASNNQHGTPTESCISFVAVEQVSAAHLYMLTASCVIVTTGYSDEGTLQNNWLEVVNKHLKSIAKLIPQIPIILVGTKVDLATKDDLNSKEDSDDFFEAAKQLCEQNKITCFKRTSTEREEGIYALSNLITVAVREYNTTKEENLKKKENNWESSFKEWMLPHKDAGEKQRMRYQRHELCGFKSQTSEIQVIHKTKQEDKQPKPNRYSDKKPNRFHLYQHNPENAVVEVSDEAVVASKEENKQHNSEKRSGKRQGQLGQNLSS